MTSVLNGYLSDIFKKMKITHKSEIRPHKIKRLEI